MRLQWKHVHFGRGSNGESEILTQNRSKIAIIPLSTELCENLETLCDERKAQGEFCLIPRLTSRSRMGLSSVAVRLSCVSEQASMDQPNGFGTPLPATCWLVVSMSTPSRRCSRTPSKLL